MQAIPCANTQALNAYLREQDRAEQRQAWIEKEAEKKLAAMQPFAPGDLDEAVCEVMNDRNRRIAVLAAFASGDDTAIGAAIQAAIKSYWLDACKDKAADDYDDGAADNHYEG